MRETIQHYWRDHTLPFVELRSTYRSVQGYKPHFHPEVSLGAVIAGESHAKCNGREHVLQQGDLVLIAPYAVHSCNPVARQPRSYHMLFIDEAWCVENVPQLQHRSAAELCDSGSPIRDSALFAEYLELVAHLGESPAIEAAARLRALLTAVIDTQRGPATPRPPQQKLAEQIKHALLARIDSPPTLDELARAFACRKETLIRAFRRAFHTTPRAFVNNARIEQAKQQLKLGSHIADVAADLGFSDQAQLHRTFVSFTASTPGQYRRAKPAANINFRQESPPASR